MQTIFLGLAGFGAIWGIVAEMRRRSEANRRAMDKVLFEATIRGLRANLSQVDDECERLHRDVDMLKGRIRTLEAGMASMPDTPAGRAAVRSELRSLLTPTSRADAITPTLPRPTTTGTGKR